MPSSGSRRARPRHRCRVRTAGRCRARCTAAMSAGCSAATPLATEELSPNSSPAWRGSRGAPRCWSACWVRSVALAVGGPRRGSVDPEPGGVGEPDDVVAQDPRDARPATCDAAGARGRRLRAALRPRLRHDSDRRRVPAAGRSARRPHRRHGGRLAPSAPWCRDHLPRPRGSLCRRRHRRSTDCPASRRPLASVAQPWRGRRTHPRRHRECLNNANVAETQPDSLTVDLIDTGPTTETHLVMEQRCRRGPRQQGQDNRTSDVRPGQTRPASQANPDERLNNPTRRDHETRARSSIGPEATGRTI